MSFIYNFILILLVGSSIYEVSSNEKPSKGWYYSVVTLMILTAGLAYGISPDWVAYWNAFEGTGVTSWLDLGSLSEMLDMEYGYMFLNKFVSMFGLGYASFTLLIAIIALYLKATTFYKYSGYVFLGLFMYVVPVYFFEEHVHVRQGLADAVTIYSVRYIIDRKLYKFLFCFLIAFLFHKASVVFLLAYWVATLRFNTFMVGGIVVIAIIANFVGLSSAIDGIMQYMPFGVAETYNDYNDDSVLGSILGDIVKILTVFVILLFNKQATEKDPYFSYFRNIYVFGVVIYFFFGRGMFSSRLPVFYTVYIVFVIPRMIMTLKDNLMFRNLVYSSFMVYTVLLYMNFYITWADKSGFGRYTTVFNKWAPYSFVQRKF